MPCRGPLRESDLVESMERLYQAGREDIERKPMGKCLSWGWRIKQSHEEIPLACLSVMRSQSGEGKGTCGWCSFITLVPWVGCSQPICKDVAVQENMKFYLKWNG